MSIKNVVASGTCIGCGACAAVVPSIKIDFNNFGDLVAKLPPVLSADELERGGHVCPFVGPPKEDEIAARLFGGSKLHPEIGFYQSTHAAYSPEHRSRGSSGGVVTWALARLLERNLVDAVVHVAPSSSSTAARFFDFRISHSVEEVIRGATSFYYPVSLDAVLDIIKNRPGRYAITGIPCFHKALRLLRQQDPVIDQRIAYQLGIVCGQMKSSHYLEYLAGHAGASGSVKSACFRRKVSGLPANDYAFEVDFQPEGGLQAADQKVVKHQVLNSKIGANWGMGYFKPNACEFCDDVLAETADFAAMDAWLPRYVKDGAGWSLIVTRTPEMKALVEDAALTGELVLENASPADVAESQRGGFNHRRGALGYRLWLNRHVWTPAKRIQPSASLPFWQRVEQRARLFLRRSSREIWLKTGHRGNFAAFQRSMWIPEFCYKLITRIKRKLG